jgi:hypothetical protein
VNRTEGFASTAIAGLLRLALLSALAWAGWSVYRHLPEDDAFNRRGASQSTALRVRLRRVPNSVSAAARRTPIQLYPIDVESVQHEYESARRPGTRFAEFMARRMGNLKPITGELNEQGEAILAVPPGEWWVHATVDDVEELTWRLPVNVSGREKTIELNSDNIYTRARSY